MGLLVQGSYLRDTLGTWAREEPSVAKETLGSLRSQFITVINLIIIIIVLASCHYWQVGMGLSSGLQQDNWPQGAAGGRSFP